MSEFAPSWMDNGFELDKIGFHFGSSEEGLVIDIMT